MWRQEVFPKVEKSIKLLFLHHVSLKCGDSKDPVATKVANVATRIFLLDSTALKFPNNGGTQKGTYLILD
jgi:hypothetical protein